MRRRLAAKAWRGLFFGILLVAVVSLISLYIYYRRELDSVKNARILLVSKQDLWLRLIDYKGNELFAAPIACGLRYGDKQKQGDMKTPEGVFQVQDILNASSWKHDFKDGNGEIEGAYGPYFIRLETPGHKGIGIHGTHDSLSIGTRVTEGCIRMKNDDLIKLVSLIFPPLTVIITPSVEDEVKNVRQDKVQNQI